MALLSDVAAGNPVTATWGNAIRNQSVQNTVSTSLPASPAEGMLVYCTDTNRLLMYDGAAWQIHSSSARIGTSVTATAWSVATGASSRTVTFGAETYDSDNFFAPSSTDVIVPTGLGGLYAISLTLQWAADPGATSFQTIRVVSGTQNYSWRTENTLFRPNYGGATFFTGVAVSTVLTAADTIQAIITQSSGAAINVNALLHVYRIGM